MLGVPSELGTALSPGAGQEDHLSAAVLVRVRASSLSLLLVCACLCLRHSLAHLAAQTYF